MKKINLSIITLILFQVISHAQGPLTNVLPNVIPSSPEQASFAKFGNYQVNLFTGLPDITIPLYEIKAGDISLPVSISYHASGIKVNDWGSWVGIGWSLNAGASVTRKVMGLADEEAGPTNGNNYLSGGTVKTKSSIHTNIQTDLDYLWKVNHGFIDAEPDIFYYNLPGKSGKFLFNQQDNLKPVLIPFNPIKISMPTSSNFKITDENGILYDFSTVETTQASNSWASNSAWLISKISSVNGQDEISFNYTERWGQVSADYQDYLVDDQGTVNNDLSHYSATFTPQPASTNLVVSSKEQKINTITFPNGKIVFYPNTNATRLDGFTGQRALFKIEIFNLDPATGVYSVIKKIYFYQSYFTTTDPVGMDLYDKRLKLDRVEITDKDDIVIEKYQFDYNTTVNMPNKLSRKRDFWGYYNDKNNNTLVPQQTVPFQDGTTNTQHIIGSNQANGRDPNPGKMQACMLKRIYYPTGGYTDFEFETNQYKDDNNVTKDAGGLRIKTIKSFDGINSNPLVKTYRYGEIVNGTENGLGRANFFNPLYHLAVVQGYRYLDNYHNVEGEAIPGCTFPVSTKNRITYYATPTLEIEPYDGSPVVYPKVTEYKGDATNNTGKVIYEFTDRADNIYDNAPTQICNKPIVTSYHMDRGQLKHKWVYKKNASTPIAETENIYQDFGEQWFNNVGMVVFKGLISEGPQTSDANIALSDPCNSDINSYKYENYNIRSTYNRIIKTTETSYDDNDANKKVEMITNYSYENPAHMLPTKISSINSKSETITSERKYSSDFPSTIPYTAMIGLNLLNKLVEEKNLRNTTQISLVQNKYEDQKNNNYLPAKIDYQLGGNLSETRAKFNNYDTKGNILDMQKADDIKSSFQWGYNGMYPIADVINASNDVKETQVTDPATLSQGVTVNANQFNGTNYSGSVTKIINLTYAGDIQIKLGSNGPVTVSGSIIITGNTNTTLTAISFGSGCETGFSKTFLNQPPGEYTITISLSAANSFGYCGQIYYPGYTTHTVTTGTKEFFYNGFEEDASSSTTNPCAGKRSKTGDYTVPFTKPNTKVYSVSYHYLQSGSWKSITKTFTDNMTLNEGDAIDEVRVAPVDAQIVSYTYEPLIGLTTKCDINNHISYYTYDSYGRLRAIKDEDGNILKLISYKYALTTASASVSICTTGNCTGVDANGNANKKCVNGSCETGTRYNNSTRLKTTGTGWICKYYYTFSDGSTLPASGEYTEFNPDPCDL